MSKSLGADLSLLSVVLIWGATFVILQDAIAFLAPYSFNAIRFFMAALALIVFYFFFIKKNKTHFQAASLKLGFILGIWLFLGYAFQTIGLLYTTPAKAGFITGLSVILVPLIAFFLMKQQLSKFAVVGVMSATAGLYMFTLFQSASFGKGDFYRTFMFYQFCHAYHHDRKICKNRPCCPIDDYTTGDGQLTVFRIKFNI